MAEPTTWCVITGAVTARGPVIGQCRLTDEVPPALVGTGEGTARVEWVLAEGDVLASYPLTLHESVCEPREGAPASAGEVAWGFGVAVPAHVEAAVVRVVVDGEATEVRIGEQAPEVAIVEGPTGEPSSPLVPLRWSSPDADNVQVTVVGPELRMPVAVDALADGGGVVDLSGVSGSELHLELAVTKDVRTTVEWVGPFALTRREADSWLIVSPTHGEVRRVGEVVELRAVYLDDDDASLQDAPVRWESSIDGLLAEGTSAIVALAAGEHEITLRRGHVPLGTTSVAITD